MTRLVEESISEIGLAAKAVTIALRCQGAAHSHYRTTYAATVDRLMATVDPSTNKAMGITKAMDAAKLTPEVEEAAIMRLDADCEVEIAKADYEMAKLTAAAAVPCAESEAIAELTQEVDALRADITDKDRYLEIQNERIRELELELREASPV